MACLRILHRPRQPLLHTPEVGGKISSAVQTQVGRALDHQGSSTSLPIRRRRPFDRLRRRSDRLFATLQDRLPTEMRLVGIQSIEAANAWAEEPLHRRAQCPIRSRSRTGWLALRLRRQRDVARSSASSRSARSPTTTPSPGMESACNCRKAVRFSVRRSRLRQPIPAAYEPVLRRGIRHPGRLASVRRKVVSPPARNT